MAKTKGTTDLDRIGLFKEMDYLHGVEYVPFRTSFNPDSKKGKQMETGGCTKKKAATQDGYFDKEFARVFEGEGYADPIRMRRMFRLENSKKNRPGLFKPTSPTKKASGKGSNFGTFQQHSGEVLPSFSPVEKPFVKVPCPAKNCLITPIKKGTGYGYANVSLSKDPPYFAEGEYEKLKEMGEVPPEVIPGIKQPFVLGSHEATYFKPNPFFEPNPKPIYRTLPKEKPIKVPFIPPCPAKRDGGMKAGCMEKYPTHMSFASKGPAMESRGTTKYVNSSGQMFLPVKGPRPYPISSTVAVNVKRAVNIQNFQKTKGVVYIKK